MTMPASQPVDYVALLDFLGDYWNPEGDTGTNIRSLMAQLTALREATAILRDYTQSSKVRRQAEDKFETAVANLTYTNPRDAHG